MFKLKFLLPIILPLNIFATEREVSPEWQQVISLLDKKSVRFADNFFSEYLKGNIKVEEIQKLNAEKRAAIAAIAVTEFLRKDFLKRHPEYKPGAVYELVAECSKKDFGNRVTSILRKASGANEKELFKSIAKERSIHSRIASAQIPHTIATLSILLTFRLFSPTAAAFLFVPLLFLAGISSHNAEFIVPARYGKQPILKIARSKADRKFEEISYKAARLAEIDPDILVILHDHQRGPRIPTFLASLVNPLFKERKITISSLHEKLPSAFSKKELASILRHEFRHTRQILPIFSQYLFFALLMYGLQLTIFDGTVEFSDFLRTKILPAYLFFLLGIASQILFTRMAEDDADNSAIKFMVKKFGEKRGRIIYATAVEKTYLLGRAHLPVMILPNISKKMLRLGDITHGGVLKRIRKLAEGRQPQSATPFSLLSRVVAGKV